MVDGLWELKARHHEDTDLFVPGGILTLDGGRIFGGDGAIVFTGSYAVAGDRMTASGRAWSWNPETHGAVNVFGMTGPIDMLWGFEGRIEGARRITGFHYPIEAPEMRLPVIVTKMTDLP